MSPALRAGLRYRYAEIALVADEEVFCAVIYQGHVTAFATEGETAVAALDKGSRAAPVDE
jgi:hypothetical protein